MNGKVVCVVASGLYVLLSLRRPVILLLTEKMWRIWLLISVNIRYDREAYDYGFGRSCGHCC